MPAAWAAVSQPPGWTAADGARLDKAIETMPSSSPPEASGRRRASPRGPPRRRRPRRRRAGPGARRPRWAVRRGRRPAPRRGAGPARRRVRRTTRRERARAPRPHGGGRRPGAWDLDPGHAVRGVQPGVYRPRGHPQRDVVRQGEPETGDQHGETCPHAVVGVLDRPRDEHSEDRQADVERHRRHLADELDVLPRDGAGTAGRVDRVGQSRR